MALFLGPDFHSISTGRGRGGGRGGGQRSVFFPPLAWKELGGESWTRQRPRAGRAALPAPSPLQGRREGFGPRAPPSFVQCRSLRVQDTLWYFPWRGGGVGLQARGERDPRLQPRLAPRGSPHHCPQRLGGGAARLRSAPPHPPPRRKPRGPPLQRPRRGSRPWWRPPRPPRHRERRAGARLTVMCGMLFLPW